MVDLTKRQIAPVGRLSRTAVSVPVGQKSITSLIRYIVLIPLLAPHGFEEVISGYKSFMTAWAMFALLLIVFDCLLRLRLRDRAFRYSAGLVTYFVVAIVVTAVSPEGMTSGLQELFFFPAAVLYLLNLREGELREYAVASAVILLVLFVLQLLIPSSLFAGAYHMTFLGHVQVFSQYGLLGFLLGFMIFEKRWGNPLLAVALVICAILAMVTADADSAHLSLVVFFAVLTLLKIVPPLRKIDLRIVVLLAVALSAAMVYVTINRQSPLIGTALDWTFSGRLFVWQSADALFREAPLLGYGVENPPITVFWNNAATSYAHNQLMQSLLDGGVVLLAAMVWMLWSVASLVNKIADPRVKRACAATLCALLFVMLFDSFTPYSYVFIALALMAREGMLSREETPNGIQPDKA